MTMRFAHAYEGRRVFLTGHTGFKGSWMALWLGALGAKVTGYALRPPTTPSLFDEARVREVVTHFEQDIRDLSALRQALFSTSPEIVFHFAAQPVVLRSYEEPLLTLETNVMGTANLLEAVREYCAAGNTCAVVIVTSDKCYANQEWIHGYRESDPLGGSDPYSMSKGAAELVVASWRHSFFPAGRFDQHRVSLASARAGNVIGGGDWTRDRIVVDCIRDLTAARPIRVRNSRAIRPWQHVLEPLSGYLLLGSMLLANDAASAARYGSAWNFGPAQEGVWTVGRLVDQMISLWGSGEWEDGSDPNAKPETQLLTLAIDKAVHELKWAPVWTVDRALEKTVEWFQKYQAGSTDLQKVTLSQIDDYTADARAVVRLRLPATIANT